MKSTTPITTLFLDIGDVLLTDGWDHLGLVVFNEKRAFKGWRHSANRSRKRRSDTSITPKPLRH